MVTHVRCPFQEAFAIASARLDVELVATKPFGALY